MSVAAADRNWLIGGTLALAGHAAIVAGVLATASGPAKPIEEDPVVLVELPAMAAAAPPTAQTQALQPAADVVPPPAIRHRIEAPPVRAPLPREVVAAASQSLTPPLPVRIVQAPVPLSAPAARTTAAAAEGSAPAPGTDPKAKQQEANYFGLVSAHLERKKRYPAEAKKARQQGVVTVRFTVHSDGRISGASIRRGSGHDLLDQATLDLMQRVAPLPKFPKSMVQDSVTLSLPIDYSLRTS